MDIYTHTHTQEVHIGYMSVLNIHHLLLVSLDVRMHLNNKLTSAPAYAQKRFSSTEQSHHTVLT